MASGSSRKSVPGTDTKVRVLCRVRPALAHEAGEASCVMLDTNAKEGAAVLLGDPQGQMRAEQQRFVFDAAYGCDATQDQIFTTEVEPVLKSVLGGVNTTIFAFGMTGTGPRTARCSLHDWSLLLWRESFS